MKRSSGKTLFDFFGKKKKSQDESQSNPVSDFAVASSSRSEVSISPTTVESQTISSVTEPTLEVVTHIENVVPVSTPTQTPCQLQLDSEPRDPIHGRQAASQFFTNGPFQPNINKYPETKGRKFRSTWYTDYTWLEYSIVADKAFCFPCRLFGSTGCYDETFISKGFQNWKKAVQRFKEHEKTSSHLHALQRWHEGLKTKESVVSKISTHHQEEVKNNRDYLKILFQSLLYLGKQGIAFRGHREHEKSDNRGNYIELLKLRSTDNTLLKQKFLDRDKFFNYVHHDVQNEMIEIMADLIRQYILDDVKKSKYLSVLLDETPDVSHHEQVTLVIRHVTEELEIKESFLGFYKTDFTDGDTLYKLLLSILAELGIDPTNVIAQCFDGAGNMSGTYKGVAARMKEQNPHVMYVHCYMHSLNLALVDASKGISSVRNVFSTLQQIYCFIEASPKRHAVFATVKSSASAVKDGGNENLSLKALSDTRFSSRYESLRAVHLHLVDILHTLENIETTDPKTGGEAHGLVVCITKFEFVFALNVMKPVFEKTNILSKYIQGHEISIHEVVRVADSVVASLTDLRNEEEFNKFFSKTLTFCESHGFEGPTNPRKRKLPQKLGGGDVQPEYDSPEAYFLKIFYYPLLDTLIENIKSRFQKNQLDLLCKMEVLLTASMKTKSVSDDSIEEACSAVSAAFGIESDTLASEINLFRRKEHDSVQTDRHPISQLLQEFKQNNHYQKIFPNLFKLLRIFITVPVSTATAERSFSVLKRVKNYLRNTMLQERLSNLAILAIEKDQAKNIDIDKCVEIYARRKPRHLSLF